jgi:outer membrane biosynthesis protein TonB
MFVLLVAAGGALPAPRSAEALDPLTARVVLVFFKSIKRATADRAQAIGTVNASLGENLQVLEQKRQVAAVFESKGWITPEQRVIVDQQLDELKQDYEDVARRQRDIVRHDTKFTSVLGENLRAEAKFSAPQILVKLGVPEFAARVAGAVINREKPVTALLDAAITKVSGGELVSPAEDPFADLKEQVGALQEATDAMRGISKARLAAQLLGVREKLEEITGLPLPQQQEELEALRGVVEEAEKTLEEAGKVRSEWAPSWSGPSYERFARDAKMQALIAEATRDAETRIPGAVAAGIGAVNEKRLVEALEAAGKDPTDEAIADLRAAIMRARAEAWAEGRRPPVDELIKQILAPKGDGEGGGGVPTSPGDEEPPDEEPSPEKEPEPGAETEPEEEPETPPEEEPEPEPEPETPPEEEPEPEPEPETPPEEEPEPDLSWIPAVVEGWVQSLVTNDGVSRAKAEELVAPAAACLEGEAKAGKTQAEATALCQDKILPVPEPEPTNFAGSFFGPNVCAAFDAPYKWTVTLAQNATGVSGTITFHACPDGGRATYSVSGTATSAASVTLTGNKTDGRGPLGGSAPASQSFTWTPPGPPSPNYAP